MGMAAISRAFEYRIAELEILSNARHIPERVHLLALAHAVHNDEGDLAQLFRAFGLEIVTPYLDSDYVRLVFAFDPRIRYYANGRFKWLPKALIEKRLPSHHQLVQRPKRSGGFDIELRRWMKSGVLRDVVHAMRRPDYITAVDFQDAIENPDWFTWNLLTSDIFQKRVLKT